VAAPPWCLLAAGGGDDVVEVISNGTFFFLQLQQFLGQQLFNLSSLIGLNIFRLVEKSQNLKFIYFDQSWTLHIQKEDPSTVV
jgi:hypothetical protein